MTILGTLGGSALRRLRPVQARRPRNSVSRSTREKPSSGAPIADAKPSDESERDEHPLPWGPRRPGRAELLRH